MLQKGRKIVIKSDEKRFVLGEVYSAGIVDTDTEAMTSIEIENMAHRFLLAGRIGKIDVAHDLIESGCIVAESMFVRWKNDPNGFLENSWVIGAYITEGSLWTAVKSGELNAFSFHGPSQKQEAFVTVNLIKRAIGETELSLGGLIPEHSHKTEIKFEDDGKVIPGFTEEMLGHRHMLLKTCATNSFLDHSHRIILV